MSTFQPPNGLSYGPGASSPPMRPPYGPMMRLPAPGQPPMGLPAGRPSPAKAWEAGNPTPTPTPIGTSLRDQILHNRKPGMSIYTDPITKKRLSIEEATQRGPFFMAGWKSSGREQGASIDAHIYGDTVAPVSEAGQHMGSLDKGSMYHGLDDFGAKNKDQMTSWGESWADAHVPKLAHGGGVPPGMPFIAGDPQADGKPNPELILPMPNGGVHVMPLKNLPKYAYGTLNPPLDPSRVNMGAFDEGFVPNVKAAGGSFGQLGRAENLTTAFNDQGQMVGYSEGLPAPQMPAAPRKGMPVPPADAATTSAAPLYTPDPVEAERQRLANLVHEQFNLGNLDKTQANVGLNQLRENKMPLEEIRQGLSTEWQANQRRQQEALDKARNPEGIIVGVTPRTPLRPVAGVTEQPSRAERQYSRMERQVLREARRDPRLAFGLLANRAEAAQAEKEARDRAAMLQWQEGKRDARSQAARDAAQQRWEERQQMQADKANIEMNFRLAEEARKQAEFAQQFADPNLTPVPIPGTNYGYVPQTKSTLPMTPGQPGLQMTELPGTGTFFPSVDGKPNLDMPFSMTSPGVPDLNIPPLNLPWLGRTPGLSVKGEAPTFKPVPKEPKTGAAKIPDAAKQRSAAYKQAIETLKSMEETSTGVEKEQYRQQRLQLLQRQYEESLRDLNGDGVPDTVPGGSMPNVPGQPTNMPLYGPGGNRPSSAFLRAVQ